MKKLKEVLLVDDSKGTNILNTRLLHEMGVVEKVSTALNGQLALDYLTTKGENDQFPNPEVIFLDINMPVMDGYQFLKKYVELEEDRKTELIIVMLTTSISEVDVERAIDYKLVKGYHFKPLTKDKVFDIIKEIN